MNKFQFLFHEIDSDESLIRLAHCFGANYINGMIRLPQINGTGSIQKIKLEDGLHLRVWDFQLSKPFIFDKASDTVSTDRVFHIAYLLNPEALLIKTKDMEQGLRVQPGMNTLFVSNDINVEVEISTEGGLHAIDISFTTSWLQQTFTDADEQLKIFINQLLNSPTPTVFFESTTAAEYRLLADLHHSGLAETKDSLHIKAGALSLLSDFFSKIFSKAPSEVLESNFFYHDKMLEVENILRAHLQKKLPGIETIARQVALSESTLKRHFKLMFGKSVYEYYLELKMDLAKRMILEKTLSVNEVASMLDYEKVSNFIDMFKRYHGTPPGAFRRKSA